MELVGIFLSMHHAVPLFFRLTHVGNKIQKRKNLQLEGSP